MCSWIPTKTRLVRVMGHRLSREPGSTPPTSNASWLTARRRSLSSAFLAARVKAHGGGEYARRAQCHRLYLVFVLPLAGIGPSAHLVQVLRLSLTDGDGPTGRAARTGAGPPRRGRSPGLGQQCGLALSGPARAPSRHRIPERSRPGQVSHARCDDRRRESPSPHEGGGA